MTAKALTKKTKTAKSKAAATSKPKTTHQPKENNGKNKTNLGVWNLRLGLLLVAEAVAVVVAGSSKTVELTMQYLSKDALTTDAAGSEVLATAVRHLADVRISWMVAAFLLVFAATFLLTATVLRKHYEAWLKRGVNKARWIGYGLGTGLMAVSVAALSGITDVGYLFLIFASLAILGALADDVELIGTGRKLRKFTIVVALFTAALPVLVIGSTLLGVILYDGSLTAYMYYVYASMFLVAAAFALACILRLRRRGKWADMDYSEKMFMGLGFAAATILAMQIFAGVIQP